MNTISKPVPPQKPIPPTTLTDAPRTIKRQATHKSKPTNNILSGLKVVDIGAGLTDDYHPFSIDFKGFGRRGEIWLTKISFNVLCYIILSISAAFIDGDVHDMFLKPTAFMVIYTLFTFVISIFVVLPCFLRRSRQYSGDITLGAIIWGGSILSESAQFLIILLGGGEYLIQDDSLFFVWNLVILLFGIPLFFSEGDYAGKKNDLMRAAIRGDLEKVKAIATQRNVFFKSEKGFTAREYAEKAQRDEVAAFLKNIEEQAKC